MTTDVIKYIPITIIVVSIITLLINYILITKLKMKIPILYQYILFSSVLYFIYGYIISIIASKKKCNKINHKISIIHGIKAAVYSILTYILIYFINPFRQPFIELFGDGVKGNSIAEIFYISLNLIISIITNYFESANKSCKMNMDELNTNMQKLDKYLSKKPRKKRVRNIIVKD